MATTNMTASRVRRGTDRHTADTTMITVGKTT